MRGGLPPFPSLPLPFPLLLPRPSAHGERRLARWVLACRASGREPAPRGVLVGGAGAGSGSCRRGALWRSAKGVMGGRASAGAAGDLQGCGRGGSECDASCIPRPGCSRPVALPLGPPRSSALRRPSASCSCAPRACAAPLGSCPASGWAPAGRSLAARAAGEAALPYLTGTIAYKAPEARGNNRSVMPLDAFYWAARVLQWREQYVDANSEMRRQPCEAPSWLGSSLATIGRELGMPRKHVLVTAC